MPLRVEPGELDLDRFRQQFEEGRRAQAAGDHERASLLLSEALSLWRGSPLADFAYEAFASSEIARLEELHLSALSEWVDAELASRPAWRPDRRSSRPSPPAIHCRSGYADS